MSSDDYLVDPLRDSEVRAHAKTLRAFFKYADVEHVDLIALEQAKEIWTVDGIKPFRLEIVSDDELPTDSGLTSYNGKTIIAKVPRRIRHGVFMGVGYPRYTIAHELGHATLHVKKLLSGASLPRRRIGNVTPAWIPKFKSAEHQAMVFGAAFLIHDDAAKRMSSAEEISVQAGISPEAARIYFEQTRKELERPASSYRIRLMVDEAAAVLVPKQRKETSYLSEMCSQCGQQKLFPVGHKFMCQACDTIYDRFQDGDPVQ